MNIVGIIAEYNPFHIGHAYHILEAKRASGAEYTIVIMSGSVVQRGTFARHDLLLRTEMALKGGADIVFLLPTRFSCASAPDFAQGGVSLLTATGVVTHLSFGCESETISLLKPLSRLLMEEPPVFSDTFLKNINDGYSFPKSRALACEKALGIPGLAEHMKSPNLTLALEYLRALPETVIPVPVIRVGADYADCNLSKEFASALAIRCALEKDNRSLEEEKQLRMVLPFAEKIFKMETKGEIHKEEMLTPALLYLLRTMDRTILSNIYGMDEGLEARFLDAARKVGTRDELLSLVKTKRYTYTHLSRTCLNILLGITKEFAATYRKPTYLRLLGFRKKATPLLHTIRKRASLPIIAKCADYDLSDPMFSLDLRARDLWSLGAKNPTARAAGMDFLQSPIIV